MASPAARPVRRGERDVAEVRNQPGRLRVYEHGWQSWSPTGLYPATATSPRPRHPGARATGFRPERAAPDTGFQGEGLLAVVTEDGATRLWHALDPWRAIPSIRAAALSDRVVVSADGPVTEVAADSLGHALTRVADTLAAAGGVGALAPLGPGWCSWYAHWGDVTEGDVVAALEAIDRLALDVAVVQVDDGHQAEIGDWLTRASRFGPLDALADRIRGAGHEAGVWTAPFLVGANSELAAHHPDWLVDGVVALHHWGQNVGVLDVTHPDAAEHLGEVYRTLHQQGFTYHKIDFCYAGAMPGQRHADATALDAYGEGLRIIRDALGPEATILGCGAPLLPSIGWVDAMRISPDIAHHVEPVDGDFSQPSQRSAAAAGRARRWMHGRWWINDPDCLVVRPEVEQREAWARELQRSKGLVVSSDPLDELDARGLAWTRELLRPASPEPLPAAAAEPPPAATAEPPDPAASDPPHPDTGTA